MFIGPHLQIQELITNLRPVGKSHVTIDDLTIQHNNS